VVAVAGPNHVARNLPASLRAKPIAASQLASRPAPQRANPRANLRAASRLANQLASQPASRRVRPRVARRRVSQLANNRVANPLGDAADFSGDERSVVRVLVVIRLFAVINGG